MPTTARGYVFPGNKAVDVPGDMQALAQSINDDVDTHEAAKTGVHGIPSMTAGQGLVWTGSGWAATDVATQAELDAKATDYEHAFSTWKPYSGWCAVVLDSGAFAGRSYPLAPDGNDTAVYVGAFAALARWLIPINLPDVDAGARTVQMRIAGTIIPNAVVPGVTITPNVRGATTSGNSGSTPSISAVDSSGVGGTAQSGFVANTPKPFAGPAYGPADGVVVALVVNVSGAPAGGSVTVVLARLEYNQT